MPNVVACVCVSVMHIFHTHYFAILEIFGEGDDDEEGGWK